MVITSTTTQLYPFNKPLEVRMGRRPRETKTERFVYRRGRDSEYQAQKKTVSVLAKRRRKINGC